MFLFIKGYLHGMEILLWNLNISSAHYRKNMNKYTVKTLPIAYVSVSLPTDNIFLGTTIGAIGTC